MEGLDPSIINRTTLTAATTLQLPDDFAPAVKYAAMAHLLSIDGEAANPLVSEYCSFRYYLAVQAARLHRSILRVQVGGLPIPLVPLYSLSTLRPGWHNQLGRPEVAGTAYDLLAFSPSPDSSTAYSITCDVARAAPIPADADFVLIGSEEIDNILAYCQHQLSIKLGGSEFRQTFPQFDNFLRRAIGRNSILGVQSRYLTGLFDQPRWDQAKNPYALDRMEQEGQGARLSGGGGGG